MDMPPRVLLVDDQRDITRFLRTALETFGRPLRIDEALSAEEALLALRDQATGPVDVLVADLRLPGMSGLQLLERARRLSPRTRSLVISGAADGEMRREAERLGAAAVLDKPIELKVFLETVQRLLALSIPSEPQPAADGETPRPARRENEPEAALRRELDALAIARLTSEGQWRTRLPETAEAVLGPEPLHLAAQLLTGHWHVIEALDALLILWREGDDVLVAQFAELTSPRLAAVRRRLRREPARATTTPVPVARTVSPAQRERVALETVAPPLSANGLGPAPANVAAPLPLNVTARAAAELSDNDLQSFEKALADLGQQDAAAFWGDES